MMNETNKMVSVDKVIDEIVLLIESIEQQEGHTIISRTLENPPYGYCGWSSVREYVTEMVDSIQCSDLSNEDNQETIISYELLEFCACCDFDPVEDDDNLVEIAYRHGECGSIDSFDTLDDALNELKNHKATAISVAKNGEKKYEVYAYAVQEVFNDNGVYSEGELYYGYC